MPEKTIDGYWIHEVAKLESVYLLRKMTRSRIML